MFAALLSGFHVPVPITEAVVLILALLTALLARRIWSAEKPETA